MMSWSLLELGLSLMIVFRRLGKEARLVRCHRGLRVLRFYLIYWAWSLEQNIERLGSRRFSSKRSLWWWWMCMISFRLRLVSFWRKLQSKGIVRRINRCNALLRHKLTSLVRLCWYRLTGLDMKLDAPTKFQISSNFQKYYEFPKKV